MSDTPTPPIPIDPNTRRVVAFRFLASAVLSLFPHLGETHFRVLAGIPPDAAIVGGEWEPATLTWLVYVWSASFEPCDPEGQVPVRQVGIEVVPIKSLILLPN